MKQTIQTFAAATCLALLIHSPVAAETAASDKTLKVYILAGQSNMQGLAGWWVVPGLADDPTTRHLYEKFMDEEGNFREEENVHVAALSGDNEAVEKKRALDDRLWRRLGRKPEGARQARHAMGTGVGLRGDHGGTFGESGPDHQNLMGREKLEHRFPLTKRRSLRVSGIDSGRAHAQEEPDQGTGHRG